MQRFNTVVCAFAMWTGCVVFVPAEANANPFYVAGAPASTGMPYAASPVNGYVCQDGTCPQVPLGHTVGQPVVYPQPVVWGPQYGNPQQIPAYPVQQPVYYAPAATTGNPTFEYGQVPFGGAQLSVPPSRIRVPAPGNPPNSTPRPVPVRQPQASPITPGNLSNLSNPFYTAPTRQPQPLPAMPQTGPIRENRPPTPTTSGQLSGLESPFYP